MRAYNPSPKIVPRWAWAGCAMLAAMLVAVALVPRYGAFKASSGWVAFALLASSAAYMGRKRLFLSSLGTLHAWMVGHIVLGVVVMGAIAIHGGAANVGTQGWLLYGLSALEFASGLWGVYELKATPRRYAEFSSDSIVHPSAVRTRIRALLSSIERDLERRKEEFRDWFQERYSSLLEAQTGQLPELEGFPKGRKRHAQKLHSQVEQYLRMQETRRRLEAVERRSQRWLYLHVPTAIALVVLVLLHVVGALYY